MDTSIIRITEEAQIRTAAELAQTVWHQTYDTLLPAGQVNYMLEAFQSVPAIHRQLETEGYQYYLLTDQETPVGFFAVIPAHKTEDELFLSKIYLLPSSHGKGIARRAFAFLEELAAEGRFRKIWLTVSKENKHAQEVYRHFGFTVREAVVIDIGGGYVMDDYVMEKSV